jgi:hypothetical protein
MTLALVACGFLFIQPSDAQQATARPTLAEDEKEADDNEDDADKIQSFGDD